VLSSASWICSSSLPPSETKILSIPVAEVMTTDVESIDRETHPSDALRLMLDRHFRHLPIVDKEGRLLGILSIRNLLQQLVENLEDSLKTLNSYYSADGPGG